MAIQAAVLGASGYSGGELIRLILNHPEFELGEIYANSHAGEKLSNIHPQFAGLTHEFKDVEEIDLNEFEVFFFALPAGVSGALLKERELKARYIDLGADFRLLNKKDWKDFYPGKYSGTWTYGLPELIGQRETIKKNRFIANPGCYATAAALGILPAAHSKIIEDEVISIVAASGTTGAGRSLKPNLLNSEANNNLSPYRVGGLHQHIPEIEQTINFLEPDKYKVSFIPILAPMPRGILLTINFNTENSSADLQEIYIDYFQGERFVKILEPGSYPNTRAVIGSNSAQIAVFKDSHTGQAQIVVAIDNLGKGAAGQAIQNANLLFGFSEDFGLATLGIGS
jgi:N-acetyl-gamma-glutamyl-phosphate reductase